MTQNAPYRNHWVPKMLLRNWLEPDGRLRCWKREGAALVDFRPEPDDVMFKKHLYTLEHTDDPGAIEGVFRKLESIGARVVAKALDPRLGRLTREEMHGWSVFIIAMALRTPESINARREENRAIFDQEFSEPDLAFSALVNDPLYPTPGHYMAAHSPATRANLHLRMTMRMMVEPRFTDEVLRMKWRIRYLPPPRSILIGDRPLISGGEGENSRYILLPISPSAVFVATSNDLLTKAIGGLSNGAFTSSVNNAQALKAKRLIIGNVERVFLERRFSRDG